LQNHQSKSAALRAKVLRRLGIERTSDIHQAYSFLETVELEGRRVKIAKWPTTRYHIYWPGWIKKPVTLLANHVALLAQILAGAAQGRVVIVREFTNWLFVLLVPFIFPLRRRVILNINDNLAPRLSGVSKVCFDVLRRLDFPVLLLDGGNVARALCERTGDMRLLTPYFAVPDRRAGRATRGDPQRGFTVGFVGYFRHDKGGIEVLSEAVRRLVAEPGIATAVGYWNRDQIDALPGDVRERVILRDTFDRVQYFDYLRSCHVIVVLAAEEFYQLRHSGVLVDAISCGTLALCPAFPLFRYQVLHPVPVGATYDSLSDLPLRVRALRDDYQRLQGNFDRYFRLRAPEAVGAQMAEAWIAMQATTAAGRRSSR